jgi:hypothetical protein
MVIEYVAKYSATPLYGRPDGINELGGNEHYPVEGTPICATRRFQALSDKGAISRARSLLPDSLELREILFPSPQLRLTVLELKDAKLEELVALRKVI